MFVKLSEMNKGVEKREYGCCGPSVTDDGVNKKKIE